MELVKKFSETRNKPRVSVVIVNYNAGLLLNNCIQHVLASSIELDIIIVDNASSDTSITDAFQTFQNAGNLCIYRSPENLGFARANNFVFPYIETEYILYLNPDCFIGPEVIQKMLELMDENPKAGMSGCLILNEDGSEQKGCRGLTPTPWRSMMQFLPLNRFFPKIQYFSGYTLNHLPLPPNAVPVELISGAFMFARRQAIEEVGLLDENYFLYCEDYDWFYRFQEKGWKILFSPHVSVTHLKGACGKKIPTKILWYKTKGMLYYYKKFFQKKNFFLKNWFIKTMIFSRFLILASFSLASTTTAVVYPAGHRPRLVRGIQEKDGS